MLDEQAIERLPLVGSDRAHNDPSQVNCHVGHVEPSKQLLFRKSEENATTPFFTTSRSHDGVLPPPTECQVQEAEVLCGKHPCTGAWATAMAANSTADALA